MPTHPSIQNKTLKRDACTEWNKNKIRFRGKPCLWIIENTDAPYDVA